MISKKVIKRMNVMDARRLLIFVPTMRKRFAFQNYFSRESRANFGKDKRETRGGTKAGQILFEFEVFDCELVFHC